MAWNFAYNFSYVSVHMRSAWARAALRPLLWWCDTHQTVTSDGCFFSGRGANPASLGLVRKVEHLGPPAAQATKEGKSEERKRKERKGKEVKERKKKENRKERAGGWRERCMRWGLQRGRGDGSVKESLPRLFPPSPADLILWLRLGPSLSPSKGNITWYTLNWSTYNASSFAACCFTFAYLTMVVGKVPGRR